MTTVTPAQSRPGQPLRIGIESQLTQILGSPINPDRSNSGKLLWTIYFWQVVTELAKKRCENSWEEIQKAGGLVDSDDRLRELAAGEHIATESNKFTALIKLSEPRRTFNTEEFVSRAARKFRVPASKIEALIEDCKLPGKPALTKRIVEIE